MYKPSNENIQLVSVPSNINNNLSLLGNGDDFNAEILTVIHGGYVNVIPLNGNPIRPRYIPLHNGKHRGEGNIKEVKWFNIRGESYLVILSNKGIQIYQSNTHIPVFRHECLEDGDGQGYMQGVCCVNLHYLCIGSSMGTIWIFKQFENCHFEFVNRQFAHNGPIIYLSSNENDCISSGLDKKVIIWTVQHGIMTKFRELTIYGLNAACTCIIFSYYTIICGYETGEIAIFDEFDKNLWIRNVAHRLEISAIDFSYLRSLILTASKDAFVKIWKLTGHTKNDLKLQFSIQTSSGPIVGAQFLNENATEFGVVSPYSAEVSCYKTNEAKEGINNNHNVSGVFKLDDFNDDEEKDEQAFQDGINNYHNVSGVFKLDDSDDGEEKDKAFHFTF